MKNLLQVDNGTWIWWAVLLLLLPIPWLLAVLVAAFAHEVCHVCAICLLGGRIHALRLGPYGAVIEAEGVHGLQEALCALAGPFGSFCLLFLTRKWPMLGLCGLLHGSFNLLPIYPMDGGRAVLRMLEYCFPTRADQIAGRIELGTCIFLFSGSVLWLVKYEVGYIPICILLVLLVRGILRKRP